jgi:hypothetical protein
VSAQSRLGRTAVSRLGRLHAAQRSRCFYCQQPIILRLPGEPISPEDATIDHFFPKSEGGPDGWRNWVLACRACNHQKASRQPTEAQMLAWNTLASAWPYIRPIDLDLVRRKRCVVCQHWISPMRLADSIASGSETETCRPRCGRKGHARTRPSGNTPQQLPAPAHPSLPPPTPWWSQWLAHLRQWLRF